jgi:hypothetical protein
MTVIRERIQRFVDRTFSQSLLVRPNVVGSSGIRTEPEPSGCRSRRVSTSRMDL